MSTAVSDPRIVAFEVTENAIVVRLADGRTVSVPLSWSWRLTEATRPQRQRFEIIGAGDRVHWPAIDEDISIHGMLHGLPARLPTRAKTNAIGPSHWRVLNHRSS
jgi:hypothetical protein